MSRFGRDANNCGTEVRPCQTIAQAVRLVNWGGEIYLNGSGTENFPYNCSRSNEHLGICINKSLTIIGLLSPRVSCSRGFYFRNENDERQMRVKLVGVVFKRTSLSFEDCRRVTLVNCTFGFSPELLSVFLQNVTKFQLDITGYSSFHNNLLCLMLRFLENVRNISRFVAVTVTDSHFTKNGFASHDKLRRTYRGGLKMVSEEKRASKLEYINIFCNNVSYVDNFGSFLDLSVPNAQTNETHKDVNLTFNKAPSGVTLYFSKAKETYAIFQGFRCVRNQNSGCIRILSDQVEVDVNGSFFSRVSQGLYLDSKISAKVRIFSSEFAKNKADFGGSFFATSPRGFLKINIINVVFSNSKAKKYGCTIAIGKPKETDGRKDRNESIPDELHFTLRNVTIEQWSGKGSKCSAINILLKSGQVTIEESRFYKKRLTSVMGPLILKTLGGKSNVTISNCSFVDKSENKRRAIAFQIVASNGNAGIVTISNSVFISSGKKQKALFLSPKYRIKVINITVKSFLYGIQVLSSSPKNGTFPIDVCFDKCTFTNNIYDLMLTLFDPTSVQLTIQNSIFTSNENLFQKGYAIRLNIPPLKNISFSNAVVKLENDTFDSKPSSDFALFFKGAKVVEIKRCTFRNCTYGHSDVQKWIMAQTREFYETGSGAISILTYPDRIVKNGCLEPHTTCDTHPVWQYESTVLFEDSVFEENLGLISGGVHISNGFTKFKRCVFKDNFGILQSGHIYSAYGTGQLELEDCLFSRTKERMFGCNSFTYGKAIFLYSESGGPLNLRNTSLTSAIPARRDVSMLDISSGGFVNMDNKSTMQCSEGSQLLLENATHIVYTDVNSVSCITNVTTLRYSCHPCSPGYYSLQKGTSRGLFVNSTVRCLRCPFGASCIQRNVAAKPGFWGFRHQHQLQFLACPEHYCKKPLRNSKDFNSCNGNRSGALCGKCAKGFTESLFSTECSKAPKCGQFCLWLVMTILVTLALVLYLLIKPPILRILGPQIPCFRGDLHQIRQHEDSNSGFIKITFYFYQVMELVMDTPIEGRLKIIPFLGFMISVFNFQVATINNNIGCPFAGLTAVKKEVLLSGTVFMAMANVFILYFVHFFVNLLRQKEKPRRLHYAAVFLEVLLLGYERLAEMSLKLMHCVSIGSRKCLFIDGNVPCLQWWQYILLAYVAVFILPFTLILYLGSSKLYTSSIKASEFLAACVLPLPFLIYWLYQSIWNKGERQVPGSDQDANKDVLEIIYGPFRPPDTDNKGALYWESVLIVRRLILLVIHTFITDAILRGVCISAACFLTTIHHILKNPYKDQLANKSETLSLVVLTLIAVINLPKATLFSFGVDMRTDASSNGFYLEMVMWFEVGALAFIPALAFLLVSFALLSQLARFGVFLLKYIRLFCQYRPSDLMTEAHNPLI